MLRFIDVHTHKTTFTEGVIQLHNVFPFDKIPNKSYSIGIHPWYVDERWELQWGKVQVLAKDANCLAIGECGLDKTVATPLEIQKKIFEKHIALANELGKPLIFHCVKAYGELLRCVQNAKVPIIMHDFGKNVALGQQLQQKGFYLSIGKAVFRKSFQNVLPQLNLKQIFLETDDMEYSIEQIYAPVAQILEVDVLFLQRQIQENYKSIF